MKFLEKIAFIEENLRLNDYAFCTRFRIKISLLKKWRRGQQVPTEQDVKWVCDYFNLDAKDFLNDSSTLLKEIKEGEHPCIAKPCIESDKVVYEDYGREDNARYEEKD